MQPIPARTPLHRFGRSAALGAVVAVVLSVAACSGGSTSFDGDVSSLFDGDVSSLPDGDVTADTGSPSTAGTGPTTSNDDGSPTGSDTTAGQGGGATVAGRCGVGDVNTQPFYAVAGIAADDPDGGLNVRDFYQDGAKLATLSEGTVVYVEDCHRLEDGAVWFAVETDGVFGWANSAYLSEKIPALEPTFGGRETAAKVEAVLDALAAGRWTDAAEALTRTDVEESPLVALLEEGGNLADQIEAYCQARICDAPYTITAVRGSYRPERVSPEVEVTFDYPDGTATQTFRRVSPETSFTLDTLPGQSILASRRAPEPVAELVQNPDPADTALYDAAEEIRRALLSESGPRIPERYIPTEGVVVSTDAYVEPTPGERTAVTAADLRSGGRSLRIWGYTDGVGSPIVATIDDYLAGYRRAPALLEPDTVGIDRRVGLGNTIANLAEVFPGSRVVEFHRRGRGQLADFNWSSIRLALEPQDGQWKLVAITSDGWTI